MEQTIQTTQPVQPSVLMTTLMALVENYIKDIVQKQVAEIMASHDTMRVIDVDFEKKIREIAEEVAMDAINTHEEAEYHISEDEVTDAATSAVEDHDFDSKINDAVNDAINEFDFTDVITASIKDNITFTATISVD